MKPLAYSTAVMSWPLVMSAIRHLQQEGEGIEPIDLNLGTPPALVLSATALEAFVNEISSLTHAFVYDRDAYSVPAQTKGGLPRHMDEDKVAGIRHDSRGSFYDRYKNLVKGLGIPSFRHIQELSYLRDLRDAVVHFRGCDISIVLMEDDIIRSVQEPPRVFQHLKTIEVDARPVLGRDVEPGEGEWHLTMSTNAMGYWCVVMVTKAILHILEEIPKGAFRGLVWRTYRTSGFWDGH